VSRTGGPQNELSELLQITPVATVPQVEQLLQRMGRFSAFVAYLGSDPAFFYAGAEALLAGYRDIARRIDAELPRLFVELPRVPYGVRALPARLGPDRAEYDDAPALDGSRPGWFNANAQGWRKKPNGSMAALVAHESVPGHHLQIARGQELRNLPAFRRGGFGYTAVVEGWALYAETLGLKSGFMTTRTAVLVTCNSRPGVPRGWSSIPVITRLDGRARRTSTSWPSARAWITTSAASAAKAP
jgi:uncharacterized protein (DUF885 family)